jgi:hypothetical protein
MLLRLLLLISALIALGALPARGQEAATVDVKVEGTLQVGQFLGPPNYGENPRNDKIEEAYYLQLPAALEIQLANQRRDGLNREEGLSSEYFIQLILPDSNLGELRRMIGKRVKVTGTLFQAESGHHRTSTLMQVRAIAEIQSWKW